MLKHYSQAIFNSFISYSVFEIPWVSCRLNTSHLLRSQDSAGAVTRGYHIGKCVSKRCWAVKNPLGSLDLIPPG